MGIDCDAVVSLELLIADGCGCMSQMVWQVSDGKSPMVL
jgi:hypothetical protein